MGRPFITQPVSVTLTLERSVVSAPFNLTDGQLSELDQISRDLIKYDKIQKALELRREMSRVRLIELFGKDIEHVVAVNHRNSRGKIRKINVYLNRWSYSIQKLWEKLSSTVRHREIFRENVSEGQAFRVTLPASALTRDGVIADFEKLVKQHYPLSSMVAYRGSSLEELINEEELIKQCAAAKINLTGTREPVINVRVEDAA